jgi:hypothetical protein
MHLPVHIEKIFRPTMSVQSLSSMSDNIRTPLFDERGNPEYIHKKFRCTNILDCALRTVPHLYMMNVDLDEPYIAIRKEVFDDLVLRGMIYNDKDCE